MAVIEMTTAERVGALRQQEVTTDESPLIASLIASLSVVGERHMNRKTELADYTETFEIRQFKNHFWLPAFPVTSVSSVKYNSRPSEFAVDDSDDVDPSLYHVDPESGSIRFFFSTPYQPGYLKVSWNGGMAVDTAGFIAAFGDISDAVDLEIINLMQRAGTPGGEITFKGGGTKFEREVKLLTYTRQVFESHSRTLW